MWQFFKQVGDRWYLMVQSGVLREMQGKFSFTKVNSNLWNVNGKDYLFHSFCYNILLWRRLMNLQGKLGKTLISFFCFFFFSHTCSMWKLPRPGIKPTTQEWVKPLQWQGQILNPVHCKQTPENSLEFEKRLLKSVWKKTFQILLKLL